MGAAIVDALAGIFDARFVLSSAIAVFETIDADIFVAELFTLAVSVAVALDAGIVEAYSLLSSAIVVFETIDADIFVAQLSSLAVSVAVALDAGIVEAYLVTGAASARGALYTTAVIADLVGGTFCATTTAIVGVPIDVCAIAFGGA